MSPLTDRHHHSTPTHLAHAHTHTPHTHHTHTTHTGKDWDADTEEFVYYDFSADASRTLSFSDESLKAALKEKGTLAAVLKLKSGELRFIRV